MKDLPISISGVQDQVVAKSIKFWSTCYTEDNLFWQIKEVNPIFKDNLNLLIGNESGAKKFFVPLSGKSVDPLFLIQKGHTVFAIECVKSAIEEFAKENNVNLHFDSDKSLYHTEDKSLQIYCGDFFSCPIEKYGPFDCVWDRGAFVAIEYETRESYVKMMQRALAMKETNEDGSRKNHNFKYLLEAVNYDRNLVSAPPRAVSEEDMKNFFGDWADYYVIKEPFHPDCELLVKNKLAKFGQAAEQVLYFITPK